MSRTQRLLSSAPLLFVVFCALLAARDVFSGRLLSPSRSQAGKVDPTYMLLVYCVAACLVAWLLRAVRTRSLSFWGGFQRLHGFQQLHFVKLGLATWIVYAVTIFGIRALGAPVFNVIDYGGMPIFTLLAAMTMLRDRIGSRQVLGAMVSITGIGCFLWATHLPSSAAPAHRAAWILVALLSPVFTSLCSAYQKQQVDSGMHPDEVLLYRFPIPAVLMFIWWLLKGAPATLDRLGALCLIALAGMFLPLWLLCFGFMRASLARFSSYLFLIPIFTFVLGPLFVEGLWDELKNPAITGGALAVLLGHALFEGILVGRNKRGSHIPAEIRTRAD